MDEKSLKFWFGITLIVGISSISLIIVGYFQGLVGIKDWLIPISGFVSLITVAIGSWIAVNNYLLKVEIEKRLSNTASIELNIQLLTHFSKMMQMANCRYDPVLSEKTIEGLFQKGIISSDDFKIFEKNGFSSAINKLDTALLTPAYGSATQDAALAAVYNLGKEHAILREPAIAGLSSVESYVDKNSAKFSMIEKFLDDLKNEKLNK
jgi:hypothetical protein